MKSRNLLGLCSLLALFSACGNGAPKYDATGTFETTEVLVSAEASGRLLYFDIEEGMLLKAGEEVGVVDTVQLYLKKLQLEASIKSVEEQRPETGSSHQRTNICRPTRTEPCGELTKGRCGKPETTG